MAITNGYCTRADLKVALAIGTADTADDDTLDDIVNAVSRMVDDYTGQFFYTITAGTAYFEPKVSNEIPTYPFTSISSITVDTDADLTYETVLVTTDWHAEPSNAAMFGKPYMGIELTANCAVALPVDLDRGVKIVANWGWSSVPTEVKQATVIASCHLYEARKAYLGVIGNNDTGGVIRLSQRLHPEAALLLEPFKLYQGVAV